MKLAQGKVIYYNLLLNFTAHKYTCATDYH